MWQSTLPVLNGNVVPDGSGGLIVTEACSPANPSRVPVNNRLSHTTDKSGQVRDSLRMKSVFTKNHRNVKANGSQ